MRGNILEEMLLIQEPSVIKLYEEMMRIAGFFLAPVFTIALLLEYFGEMDFGGVVKKLFLITIFMGSFYQFHTNAVEVSLKTASYTLQKVSPKNLFVKKWFEAKVKTKEQKKWSFLESFAIPNLNDLVATAFFLLAKIFTWLLKLIYSSVYHLTYVFSGLTAILFFLGWTKDALKGTFQASLWCMFLPFVIVAILAIVGNSIEEIALSGELVVSKIDTIIWLFGVTLLLLISPLITFGLVKGDGIHAFGSKMGAMVVNSGLKASALAPFLVSMPDRMSKSSEKMRSFGNSFRERVAGKKFNEKSAFKDFSKSHFDHKNDNSKEVQNFNKEKTGSPNKRDSQKEEVVISNSQRMDVMPHPQGRVYRSNDSKIMKDKSIDSKNITQGVSPNLYQKSHDAKRPVVAPKLGIFKEETKVKFNQQKEPQLKNPSLTTSRRGKRE